MPEHHDRAGGPRPGSGVHDRGEVRIRYDVEGSGFPVLLLAPGGMQSANAVWDRVPWNPRKALAGAFQLIGMDQRNAGGSTAPVTADHGWPDYAGDQLALLDHLGIDQFHVLGMCIGGPFAFGLLRAAPERIRSVVMLQPVGIDGNRHTFEDMFDQWAGPLAPDHPEADADAWAAFRHNMWGGEFVLTATPDQVAAMPTPILVAQGNDLYHPTSISREIARLAPDVTYLDRWKDDDVLDATTDAVRDFLDRHTPT